jgi:hypothetical protein
MPPIIPTPAPAMDNGAEWCGVRRSESKRARPQDRVGHKRPPSSERCRLSSAA